jgi:hypothetical protein
MIKRWLGRPCDRGVRVVLSVLNESLHASARPTPFHLVRDGSYQGLGMEPHVRTMSELGHSRRFGFVRLRRHCGHKFLRQGRDGPTPDSRSGGAWLP